MKVDLVTPGASLRHQGVADRVVLYLTGDDVFAGPTDIERWGSVAAEVVRRTSAASIIAAPPPPSEAA